MATNPPKPNPEESKGQAEEIYDLRRLRAAVEEKTRIEILFENSVF